MFEGGEGGIIPTKKDEEDVGKKEKRRQRGTYTQMGSISLTQKEGGERNRVRRNVTPRKKRRRTKNGSENLAIKAAEKGRRGTY